MDHDARMWAMFAHLSALAGYFFPFGNILGPLVIWLIKRDDLPYVNEQGKESLNFQITISIAILLCIPLVFIIIGFFLLAAILLFDLIMIIWAMVQCNKGEPFQYPVSIRIIQ